MLPKEHKLSRVTFPKYKDPKKTWAGISLRVQYTYSNSTDRARVAVVVPKKIHALAVRRNELKRAIFQSIERYGGSFLKKCGMKVVIFPTKKETVISLHLIDEDIQEFVAQLR